MSVSPVAMFEPVLRDLQCLTAPDVDAEREATLCQHISTGIQIWSDLPDSEFTAAVWEELVMVRQVFAKACEACATIASKPQTLAARTAAFVLASVLACVTSSLRRGDPQRDRLLSAMCEQAVQAKLLQHLPSLMVAATVGLQRLTAPSAPGSSAADGSSSSSGGSSSGGSGSAQKQQDAYAAAADAAYVFACNLMVVWSLLAGVFTEWDKAVFKRALPSTPALLPLALTVLQSLSKLQGVRPPAAMYSAASHACSSMRHCFSCVGRLAQPIVDSTAQFDAAPQPDPPLRKLVMAKAFLPCLTLCIAAKACLLQHSADAASAAAAGSSSSSHASGGSGSGNSCSDSTTRSCDGSSSSARGVSSTGGNDCSISTTTTWSYADALSAHSSGRYPVATAFTPQLLALLNISEQTAAVVVSATNRTLTAHSAVHMQSVMWALRLWGQVRCNTLVPPQQQVKVPAAQQEQELELLGLLPRLLLRPVVSTPSSHPDFPVSCLHALRACHTTPRCWLWMLGISGILIGFPPSLQHQQRAAAMLEGVLPLLYQVYLKLSEAVSCSRAAGGSGPQNGTSSYLDAFVQEVQFFGQCIPNYLITAMPSIGGSSSGSSGSRAASDPTLAVLQRNGANILAAVEGCLRHMAALTASSSAAGQPDAGSTEAAKKLAEAATAVGVMGVAPVNGSSPLLTLISAAGCDSMEHRQLYSLFSTLLRVCELPGMEWQGARGSAHWGILQTLIDAHLPATLRAFDAAAAASSSSSSSNAPSNPQAAATAAAAAVALPVLPTLVLYGRLLLSVSHRVQQESPGIISWMQANSGKRKTRLSDTFPDAGLCLDRAYGHKSWLHQFTKSVFAWLRCQPIAAQLTATGYDVGSLIQQLEQLLAARDAAASSCTEATLAELVRQLQAAGSRLCALAVPVFCNNPGNLSGSSDASLVAGLSCLCGGCETARYCSKTCQRVHWKAAHKPVCKALAAAAGAAGGAGGANAGGGGVMRL